MPKLKNPCCILEICCRGPQKEDARVSALASDIAESFGWSDESSPSRTGNARAIADYIMSRYDLVPKGLAGAIVTAYAPYLKDV